MGKQKAPVEKNDELVLEIMDMSADGEGIGRAGGYALFVKDAMPGDIIKAKVLKTKKNYGFARLLEILTPSLERVEPLCTVARQCGGCQIMHCSYEKQLAWKEEKVANCLRRIGGISIMTENEAAQGGANQDTIIMEPIMGMDMPYHYRNKAQFPVGCDKEGNIKIGFYAGRTHTIIPQTDCAIQDTCNYPILECVKSWMEEYHIKPYDEKTNKGLMRHILIRTGYTTGEVMVCLVINEKKLPKSAELIERLKNLKLGVENARKIVSICLNHNTKNTNVILGDKVSVLYGRDYIEDCIGDIRYRISPQSFYQVNPEQTKKLYETALSYADLHGKEVVWDLYCGIGTISLFLAQRAKQVYGVEIVPQAIEDAKKNAALNNIENAEFFVGAAEEVMPKMYEKSGGGMRADVITLDPPRKGCDEKLLEVVISMQPQRIVYVSCDPATLARDVKYLKENGYEVARVRCCDMFGHSGHVETVVLLTKTHN